MWVNGKRMQAARTQVMQYQSATNTQIVLKPGQLTEMPKDILDMYIVLYESWTAPIHQIQGIDIVNHVITLRTQFNPQWASQQAGYRYYLENFVEALDEEGEFYYDRYQNTLMYMAQHGENPNSEDIIIPLQVELFHIQGQQQPVVNLAFQNLGFMHALEDVSNCFASSCNGQSGDFLATAAIHVQNSQNVNFDFVDICHTGGYALWFNVLSQQCQIRNSYLSDLGAGGVRVGKGVGGIVPASQVVSQIVVNNSVITHGGQFYQEGVGVFVQGASHVEVSNNEISYFKYTGVSVGWTWGYALTNIENNIIQNNIIYQIGMQTLSDLGCIYLLGKQVNTKVMQNICHDVVSFAGLGWGLYTDEGSSNIELTNNIVYNTKCAGFHQHYGADNLIHNNIFAYVNQGECDGAVKSSQWSGNCDEKKPDGKCSSFSFQTNIVYVQDIKNSQLLDDNNHGLKNMTLDKNNYYSVQDSSKIKFPPENKRTWTEWHLEKKDEHSKISDPEFVDPTHFNF